MRKIPLVAQQILTNSCLVLSRLMSLRMFTLQLNLPTICLWVLLQRFIKSSIAFTNTAVVLHESTRAHVRKGGIASDKKNCIKAKKKSN